MRRLAPLCPLAPHCGRPARRRAGSARGAVHGGPCLEHGQGRQHVLGGRWWEGQVPGGPAAGCRLAAHCAVCHPSSIPAVASPPTTDQPMQNVNRVPPPPGGLLSRRTKHLSRPVREPDTGRGLRQNSWLGWQMRCGTCQGAEKKSARPSQRHVRLTPQLEENTEGCGGWTQRSMSSSIAVLSVHSHGKVVLPAGASKVPKDKLQQMLRQVAKPCGAAALPIAILQVSRVATLAPAVAACVLNARAADASCQTVEQHSHSATPRRCGLF